jgi:hypothetical protein
MEKEWLWLSGKVALGGLLVVLALLLWALLVVLR